MGLIIEVYRAADRDCTAGGISSNHNGLTLIDAAGPFDPSDEYPAVKLVTRQIAGREYKHLEPVAPVPSGGTGYMFGGNYGATSDSRFRAISQYPLAIHDRVEFNK